MEKNCLKTKKIKIHCNKSKEEDENKHHYIIKFCCRFYIQKLSRWFYFLFIFFGGVADSTLSSLEFPIAYYISSAFLYPHIASYSSWSGVRDQTFSEIFLNLLQFSLRPFHSCRWGGFLSSKWCILLFIFLYVFFFYHFFRQGTCSWPPNTPIQEKSYSISLKLAHLLFSW